MSSLREQMFELAQKLIAEAEQRRKFVAQNREATEQLCDKYKHQRHILAQDLCRKAARSLQQLAIHRQATKREIGRTIEHYRIRRARSSAENSLTRRQSTSRRRRGVLSSLQHFKADRLSMARQQANSAARTLQSTRRRVTEIRQDSRRFLSGVSSDMQAARRALQAVRQHLSQYKEEPRDNRLMSRSRIGARPAFTLPPSGFSGSTALSSMASQY